MANHNDYDGFAFAYETTPGTPIMNGPCSNSD